MMHVVREGETVRRLAARYYGNWTLWPLIVDYNKINGRDNPVTGSALSIPYPRTSPTEHIISDGDTYEYLSQLYYGSEHFSDKIKIANGLAVIYDSIGQKFTIPALADRQKITAMGILNGP